jgi:hypothetical protein
MKRFIATVGFAILAGPVAAAGLPYEQNAIDRMLPNIEERAASSGETRYAAPAAAGLPYEQYVIDRRLPNIEPRAASSGDTRRSAIGARPESPWANDYNFIAPAQ